MTAIGISTYAYEDERGNLYVAIWLPYGIVNERGEAVNILGWNTADGLSRDEVLRNVGRVVADIGQGKRVLK